MRNLLRVTFKNLPKIRNLSLNDYFKFGKRVDFGRYSIVEPGRVKDAPPQIPDHIEKPAHYKTGVPGPSPRHPEIHNDQQIKAMRKSCRLAANILAEAEKRVQVGMTTEELDDFVFNITIANNAYPAPLNYKKFPKSVCTSVNNVACHGIPDDRPLQDGDIVNVDVSVYIEGFYGDCSKTFLIGNVDEKGQALVKANEKALFLAIETCFPGSSFSSIGTVIEKYAKKHGFSVLPTFCGHGIGSYFHGPPDIIHASNGYPGEMEAGMIFTIEPVMGQGSQRVDMYDDGWTCVTEDDSRTAQIEHTILITETGAEILTTPDGNLKHI